ncbi:hypothetical protein H2509_16520 [Stappia sp. F7233]|uniref:CWH43-like N-terminal domain-containing protein n=1 Tax=Stappia albiluteola TaxID=2758565 RepID=A0A839AFU7_9HYPH|nr:hypothetical protein [Stappia albiluteola]MBA5778730.1 hypothetical protein [Stappia albiluteola]
MTRLARPALSKLLTLLLIAPMTFIIVVVNFWIYRARAEYIERFPDIAAIKPPTISRAISDPLIGKPFAFWITLSAVMLIPAFIPVCRLYWRSGGRLHEVDPAAGAAIRRGTVLLAISLAATAVGMVMLSHYTFPNHHREHMLGSYTFFIGQAVVMALIAWMCFRLARHPLPPGEVTSRKVIDPRVSRLRAPLAAASLLVAAAYLGLFLLKGVDLPAGNRLVYRAYVLLEPALISLCLAVFATYYLDVIRALGRPRKA